MSEEVYETQLEVAGIYHPTGLAIKCENCGRAQPAITTGTVIDVKNLMAHLHKYYYIVCKQCVGDSFFGKKENKK